MLDTKLNHVNYQKKVTIKEESKKEEIPKKEVKEDTEVKKNTTVEKKTFKGFKRKK